MWNVECGMVAVGNHSTFNIQHSTFFIERSKHLHAILMIAHAARLAAAVHGEDGVAHVHTTQRD